MHPSAADEARTRAMAARLWMSCLATQEQLTAYLGVRLGLYEVLRAGPATYQELAERAGIAPRYAREWLEQQAVSGFVDVEGADKPADDRRYLLPAAHAAVLCVSDSPHSLASLALLPLGGVARALPALLEAYRSGGGVADSAYGEDWRLGHSGANRALFTHQLAGWVRRSLPVAHARLRSPGARIVDVGCGAGWASIALALAYPQAQVLGVDLDAESIEDARRHASEAGIAERVHFRAGDATELDATERFDLVCLLDVLHEMSHPVDVLRACRRLRADGGTVFVVDAKVRHEFTVPGDEVERFQYATSVLHCLPVSQLGEAAEGVGTVLRPGQVRSLAAAAGFADVRVLPVQERFHRAYELNG